MVIAISPERKSASTLGRRCVKVQAQGRPVFALTADLQSPFGKASDYPLDILTGIESVGFVTRGFSATVLNLLLIALKHCPSAAATDGIAGRGSMWRSFNASRQPCRWLSCVRKRLFTSTSPFLRNGTRFCGDRLRRAGWVARQKSWKTKFTETVRAQAGLSWKPYARPRIWCFQCEHVMVLLEDRPGCALRGATGVYDACGRQCKTFTLTLAKAAQGFTQTLALDVAVDHHFAIAADCAGTTHGVSYRLTERHRPSVLTFDDFDLRFKSKI